MKNFTEFVSDFRNLWFQPLKILKEVTSLAFVVNFQLSPYSHQYCLMDFISDGKILCMDEVSLGVSGLNGLIGCFCICHENGA